MSHHSFPESGKSSVTNLLLKSVFLLVVLGYNDVAESRLHQIQSVSINFRSDYLMSETATTTETTTAHEEISYHAVQKEGRITAIWEMRGRKHIRTIDPRSEEGRHLLSHTDNPEEVQNAQV
jgi:hypothetical protein